MAVGKTVPVNCNRVISEEIVHVRPVSLGAWVETVPAARMA